jgi:hypothetical protein
MSRLGWGWWVRGGDKKVVMGFLMKRMSRGRLIVGVVGVVLKRSVFFA